MSSFWTHWFQPPDENVERIELLRSIALFGGFTENQYRILSDLMYQRDYREGETIFSLGNPASALFIIEEGTVEIFMEEGNGNERCIVELNAGDFFGERALCKELNRTATARATSPTELLVLFRPEMMDIITREKDLGIQFLMNLLEVLGDRLEQSNKRIRDLLVEIDDNERE